MNSLRKFSYASFYDGMDYVQMNTHFNASWGSPSVTELNSDIIKMYQITGCNFSGL